MSDGNNRGGFLLGLIVGLLLGLAIALGVALYVAKVPIPFVDKVPQRSSEADVAEAAANKNWNPNAALPGAGKTPPPRTAASGVLAALPPAAAPVASAAALAPPVAATPTAAAASKPTSPATALASPAAAASSAAKPDANLVFFVQAGAFSKADDAEQQRARLAMQGFNAKVYERASGERTVHRVRIGPFDDKAAADSLLAQVQGAGMEAAVVRTQR